MSKVNNVVEENIFVRYIVILSGMIISSIGINGFIRPAHLLSGGVTGLATMINYMTNINVGLLTFLINIPIFIIGCVIGNLITRETYLKSSIKNYSSSL